MNRLIKVVQLWTEEKGLLDADPKAQLLKILEELGEVTQAHTRNQKAQLRMELGDLLVTVIVFAEQVGISPEEALKVAYDKIKNRRGKLVGDTWVKEEDL